MRTPLALLKYIAKALLNAVGGQLLGDAVDFILDVLPEMAHDVQEWWGRDRNAEQRRAEIEALARAHVAQLRQAVSEAVEEAAADEPAPVRQALAGYLTQVPPTIRRALRRPGDPSGTTVPPTLPLHRPEDLLPFLPTHLPRFRPGARPLPGVDRELIELLGAGGFGEVWKARTGAGSWVALKFCLDRAAQALSRHEADLLCRVQHQGRHPGIVSLLHMYLAADPPCLEYEYVEGGDLAGLIQEWHRPPAPPGWKIVEKATHLMQHLAEIVAFAHRLQPPIVHRDLKPANILVTGEDTAAYALKVTDFGIGGLASGQAIAQTRLGGRVPSLLTALRGAHSPLYASPQQVRGDRPDPRDDVYALGVIWYQALTGDLTAGRPGGARWLRRLTEQGMSPALLDLLGACFEDSPADRPPDAAALAEALARALAAPRVRPVEEQPPAVPRIGALRRFEGHGAAVEAVACAPYLSGTGLGRAVSGSADQTVRLWDLATGHELRRFEGWQRWVLCVAFSPDGKQIISGGSDRVVRLWDPATGWERQRFEGHRGRIVAVSWSPDGRRILSGGSDRTLRLWDVASGQEMRCCRGTADLAWSAVAFSADGRRALSGSADRTVRLWALTTGAEVCSLPGHTGPVLTVAISPDGRLGLSGGWDRVARLWDLETGRELRCLEGHTGWVWSLAFSPDGRRALSGGADHTVRLWDVATGQEVLRFEGHIGSVLSVAFAVDGRCALSGGADHHVRLWGLPA
jgi:serine/threonine protein kinase